MTPLPQLGVAGESCGTNSVSLAASRRTTPVALMAKRVSLCPSEVKPVR